MDFVVWLCDLLFDIGHEEGEFVPIRRSLRSGSSMDLNHTEGYPLLLGAEAILNYLELAGSEALCELPDWHPVAMSQLSLYVLESHASCCLCTGFKDTVCARSV